ncbi:MAG: SH3 domain-containing protein [Bacteroidota bacterium]
MKNKIILKPINILSLLILYLWLLCACDMNQSQEWAKVNTNGGNLLLRSNPSIEGDIITRIPDEEIVEFEYCSCKDRINGRNGKWCFIKYNGCEGYAWGWYLQLEGERNSTYNSQCQCNDEYVHGGPVYRLSIPRRREEKFFEEILKIHGIPQDGYIICRTRNIQGTVAYAKWKDNLRYIIYDDNYFSKVLDSYSAIILSHEIGHFELDHSFGFLAPRRQQELEADEFSGRSMYLLGYSLPETLEILSNELEGTDNYPSNSERREAVRRGWQAAQTNSE